MQNQDLLGSIRGFSSNSLTPTTTVEHGGIVVNTPDPKVGHDDISEIKEFFDDENVARAQAKQIADLLRASKHAVVYTGAGISTAAKIPDYRGPKGVWTLKDRGIGHEGGLKIAQAVPTFAHMALTLLYNKGLIKYVVSTNVDGLHRRSGLPVKGLAELHGNCYKEYCGKCSRDYLRDFDCTSQGCRKDHKTGRQCDDCKGDLLDSIIHFGEGLPEAEITPAIQNAQMADFALVLGTSMKVSPACNLPSMCFRNKGKLVICNLQYTPFDKHATHLVHAPTDVVMLYLIEELGLLNEIPESTPEGFPIVRPAAYKPEELRKNTEKQLQTLANPQAHTTGKLVNVNLALKARPTEDVINKKGETRDIVTQKSNVLLVRNCSDCHYTIPNSSMKVVIERLEGSSVTVKGSVLTGTCEVISCTNSKITINNQVPTITVDKCKNCKIHFTGNVGTPQFIWSKCESLKMCLGDKEYDIPAASVLRPDADPEIAQFRSRWVNGSVTTEFVIREGGGYATTEAEKRARDENDARNEAMFLAAMTGLNVKDRKP